MKQFLLPSVLIVLLGIGVANGGHVLVFPGEYSHWLNMRSIVDELVRRNHSVTVLVSDASPSIDYNDTRDAAKFNFIVFKVTIAECLSTSSSALTFQGLVRTSLSPPGPVQPGRISRHH